VGVPGWNVPGDVVPDFLDPAVLDDPFEAYAELHERCPVFEMPQTGLSLVTRYWRITERSLEIVWTEGNPAVAGR
jgi:hypothetical protein